MSSNTPRPPFRCPHCRNVEPAIKYGELIYSSQVCHIEDGDCSDWDASDYGNADGSYYISAECQMCERDITAALMRYHAKHPGNTIPSEFVHECGIPRSLPLPKSSRLVKEWTIWSDKDLQDRIDHARDTLGYLLDEQARRSAEKQKAHTAALKQLHQDYPKAGTK